jgi:hypothetical protein
MTREVGCSLARQACFDDSIQSHTCVYLYIYICIYTHIEDLLNSRLIKSWPGDPSPVISPRNLIHHLPPIIEWKCVCALDDCKSICVYVYIPGRPQVYIHPSASGSILLSLFPACATHLHLYTPMRCVWCGLALSPLTPSLSLAVVFYSSIFLFIYLSPYLSIYLSLPLFPQTCRFRNFQLYLLTSNE